MLNASMIQETTTKLCALGKERREEVVALLRCQEAEENKSPRVFIDSRYYFPVVPKTATLPAQFPQIRSVVAI